MIGEDDGEHIIPSIFPEIKAIQKIEKKRLNKEEEIHLNQEKSENIIPFTYDRPKDEETVFPNEINLNLFVIFK